MAPSDRRFLRFRSCNTRIEGFASRSTIDGGQLAFCDAVSILKYEAGSVIGDMGREAIGCRSRDQVICVTEGWVWICSEGWHLHVGPHEW